MVVDDENSGHYSLDIPFEWEHSSIAISLVHSVNPSTFPRTSGVRHEKDLSEVTHEIGSKGVEYPLAAHPFSPN
jgi:hypothetical protein